MKFVIVGSDDTNIKVNNAGQLLIFETARNAVNYLEREVRINQRSSYRVLPARGTIEVITE